MKKLLLIIFLLIAVIPVASQQRQTPPAPRDVSRVSGSSPVTSAPSPRQTRSWDFIGALAAILSIPALLYAMKQHHDARATLKLATAAAKASESALSKLDQTMDTLRDTALQLPTRYVGKFPTNLREIIELINLAQSELTIITDFAGYSSYSDHSAFRDYHLAIETALRHKRNLKVSLYVYDSALHQRMLQTSYPRSTYSQLLFSPTPEQQLSGFIQRMERRHIPVTDYDSFIKALLDDEVRCIASFEELERCECWELHAPTPVFLWMADQRECIFAFEYEPERQNNYFSFRTRDGRLIEYFVYYLQDVASRANHHPVATLNDVPDMTRLVTVVGRCVLIGDRLDPCEYHRDRLCVKYYRQRDESGEHELDDKTVRISATPPLIELFAQMDDKLGVAGGWGLMYCHRNWLVQQIADIARHTLANGTGELMMVQLGTAGPVHYFGNASVILDGLRQGGLSSPLKATLHTYDRCITPIAFTQALLAKLPSTDTTPASNWATVEAYGVRRTFDPSFYESGVADPAIRETLQHHVAVADICTDDGFAEHVPNFDVAIAHFTFSLWATMDSFRSEQGYRNVAATLKPGGRLLAALSEVHDPALNTLDAYNRQFADVGLRYVSATRAWDIYDLSVTERKRFLYAHEPLTVRKQVILAVYEKL